MAKETIKVWIKRPGHPAFQEEIKNRLEVLKEIVGGYIEHVSHHFEPNIDLDLIMNEEGKLLGMEPNFYVWNDLYVGPVIICGHDGDELADCPADREMLEKVFPQIFAGEESAW